MTSNLTQDPISNGEIQCIISSRSAERSSSETLRGRSLANIIDYAKRVRHDGIICYVDGLPPPIIPRNYNSLPTIAPPLLTPAPNIDDSCALPSAPSPAPIPSGAPILSQMIKEYAQHLKSRRRKPRSDNEVRDQMAVFNLLLDYLGDVLVKDVTHDRLKEFLNVADRLPRNRNKNPRYRDKSFQELLALQISEKEVLSITTINKYAGWITAFFKWLTNTGRLTFQPAYDLQKEKLIHPVDEAAPFSVEELNLIVSGPAFVTKKRRNRNSFQNSRFFIPLIMLYMGPRNNEPAQLKTSGIVTTGIPHFSFDIKSSEQLKTPYSFRKIPIHPMLIRLGFLRFVEKMRRSNSPRLFMELRRSERGYSDSVSDWFNDEYLIKCGVEKTPYDGKHLYGLRHNFLDQAKQAGILDPLVDAFVGHSTGRLFIDRYGERFSLARLFVDVAMKITYDIDLRHLFDPENNPYAHPDNVVIADRVEKTAIEQYDEYTRLRKEEIEKPLLDIRSKS